MKHEIDRFLRFNETVKIHLELDCINYKRSLDPRLCSASFSPFPLTDAPVNDCPPAEYRSLLSTFISAWHIFTNVVTCPLMNDRAIKRQSSDMLGLISRFYVLVLYIVVVTGVRIFTYTEMWLLTPPVLCTLHAVLNADEKPFLLTTWLSDI